MSSFDGQHLSSEAIFESKKRSREVRLVWKITNISESKLYVNSYYCPFYHNGLRRGVFESISEQWITKPFKISNDHVRMHLFPGEMRSYVWEWVEPGYYGITESGKWSYLLHLYYSLQGESNEHVLRVWSKSIDVPSESLLESLGEFNSREIIEALQKEYPKIREIDDREAYLSLIPYRAGRVIDDVFRDDDTLIVVELDNLVTEDELKRVEQARQQLEERYGKQMKLKVEGLIIGTEIDQNTLSIADRKYPHVRIRFLKP